MINSNRVICVIPARKGSTRIKNKNIINFYKKPLIYWSILSAKKSKYIDNVFVTSDNDKILKIAKKNGCSTVKRNKRLSNNIIMPDYAVVDVLKKFGKSYEIVVFLQPTAPLRKQDDIDKALKKMIETNTDTILSVNKNKKFIWGIKNRSDIYQPINYKINARPRSQNMNQYEENGSIYITKVSKFIKSKNRLNGKKMIYEMEDWQNIDIDNKQDLKNCEKNFIRHIIKKK